MGAGAATLLMGVGVAAYLVKQGRSAPAPTPQAFPHADVDHVRALVDDMARRPAEFGRRVDSSWQPSADVRDAALTRMQHEIPWADDGNCYVRALRAASILLEESARAGGGPAAAHAGALAIVSGPFHDHPDWPFHAAIAFHDAVRGAVVVDGLASPDPVPVDEWARRLGVDPATVTFHDPEESFGFERSFVHRRWPWSSEQEGWRANIVENGTPVPAESLRTWMP